MRPRGVLGVARRTVDCRDDGDGGWLGEKKNMDALRSIFIHGNNAV